MPTPLGADQRHHLAAGDLEAHAAQHRLVAVAERHVIETRCDRAARSTGSRPSTVSGRHGEQLADAAGRRQHAVHGRGGAGQQTDLHHRRPADVEEQEEGRRRQPAGHQLADGEQDQPGLDDVVDDGAGRLLDVLVDAELDVDAHDVLQRPRPSRRCSNALGPERLHGADAQQRLLEPRGHLGQHRELIGGEAPHRPRDPARDGVVQHRRRHRGPDQPRARAGQQVAVEQDQDRRADEGADDRLQPGGGAESVGGQSRHQLARAVAREEAHRQREEVAEEIQPAAPSPLACGSTAPACSCRSRASP